MGIALKGMNRPQWQDREVGAYLYRWSGEASLDRQLSQLTSLFIFPDRLCSSSCPEITLETRLASELRDLPVSA